MLFSRIVKRIRNETRIKGRSLLAVPPFYCIMENEQRGMNTFILAVCGNVDYVYSFPQSPPSRAAWIEIPLSAIISAMYRSLHSQVVWIEALRLCDLPSLGIFINQKQGYCILDAATLFSEKTVIGEQRYSADNVYRLSHIAMFVKSFPLKTAGSVLPNRCPENCRQSKYDRLGSRAQLLSRQKSEFDNGFCGSCLKFAYNKIMMLCAQYYKY